MPDQAPQRPMLEKVLNKVLELMAPYITTGYAGQAAEALKKHNKDLEAALMATDNPTGGAMGQTAQGRLTGGAMGQVAQGSPTGGAVGQVDQSILDRTRFE